MNKQQAQQIIRDTFESSFDKNGFAVFVKNLLNEIDDAPFTYQGNYIPDAYKQYIKTLERIGKFSDGENSIDILVITLQKETSLERARTMQRNFIAWYLNGSRGGEMKDAALAAFVSPGEEDWRFSLVKMDYKFEKTKTGRMKVKEEFTPARRWSFLVGANEKSHTAQSRLVNILANDEQAPTLEEIENAFDIETVTKEFFLKYRELFLRTKEELDRVIKKDPKIKTDFETKGVDTVNFAKKLLGQIVFLYFLQKKGWFGVGRDNDWGTGSKNFLRELFDKKHGDYKNFFNDILEPLFYEALRIDRSHDDGYYSRFNCKIPFLNGGLFDPIGNYDWVHTDIIIPDQLFSNNVKTKEGDNGTGILNVFDRYNFTVREDEPLEKEVAIDPELLGKAYEKFNAIRPDNYDEFRKALKSGKKGEENKFNKKFGVYYTPREIVHYMCRQSLINYLTTVLNQGTTSYQKLGDDQTDAFGNKAKVGQYDITAEHTPSPQIKKEDIEILIHTGEHVSENEARVLNKGKETETYSHKLPESIRNNAALIDQKLADITVCDPAVGSGAFPVGMMSEIVKARNVLTPFLSLQGAQATKQSQFDDNRTAYNFKRRCIEHSLYGVDIDPGAVEIAKLRLWLSLVVDEDDIKNIKPLPNLDYKIVRGNSLIGFPENWISPISKEIEDLKNEFFSETNPGKKKILKKHIDDKLNYRYENSLKTFGYNIDFDFKMVFSEVFHEKACPERSRRGGFDVVIANPPYEEISEKTRKTYFQKNFPDVLSGHYDLYIFFFRKAFIAAKVTGLISFITPHTYLHYTQFRNLRKYIYENSQIIEITNRISGIFESAVVDNSIIFLKTGIASNDYSTKFVSKYIGDGALLDERTFNLNCSDFDPESFDINAIRNRKIIKRYSKNTLPLGKITESTQGIIVYAKEQGRKVDRFSERRLNKNYRPVVKGRDFSKYCLRWSGKYIEYGEWLCRSRDPIFFESRKLFFRQTADSIIGTYVERSMYCVDSVHSFILLTDKNEYDLRYILAILNSTLGNYFYKLFITETGKVFAQVKLTYLRRLPIKVATRWIQEPLIAMVDRIIAITKDEDYLQNPQKQKKVKTLEREIDQVVYKIYSLTSEEIKIVENS
jgi:hypothetical protein